MRPVTKITIFGVRLGVVALAAYWLIIFTGTHLPGGSQLGPPGNDKTQHFTAYFLLGTMLCYVTTSPRYLPRFLIIGIAGMTYAAIDELTQSFIPGRYPDFSDFVADSIGLWSAIAIYASARLVGKRMHQPPN
ncbi:MAG: VanZ family protein [Planctomycetaceae bacterium]|nr:VanZ family protein [Planctomycetaceae bacterium]